MAKWFFVSSVAVLVLVAVWVIRARSTQAQVTQTPVASPSVKIVYVDPPKPKPPTLIDRLSDAERLSEAVAILRPHFKDTVDQRDAAALLLAAWADMQMIWSDLNSIPETTRAKLLKDPDVERGQRICTSGTIVEIEVDRSHGPALYLGGLITASGGVVRFIVVRSTGDLVQNSAARICGIATGTNSYTNSGGGVTHAVFVVGLFDLPENRRAIR